VYFNRVEKIPAKISIATGKGIVMIDNPVPTPENIKDPYFDKNVSDEDVEAFSFDEEIVLTPLGERRMVWDKAKKIPNLEGGYFHIGQTQEEYIDNIPEIGYLYDGSRCKHPLQEQMYSRCMCCNELVPMIKRERKPFLEKSDKKDKKK